MFIEPQVLSQRYIFQYLSFPSLGFHPVFKFLSSYNYHLSNKESSNNAWFSLSFIKLVKDLFTRKVILIGTFDYDVLKLNIGNTVLSILPHVFLQCYCGIASSAVMGSYATNIICSFAACRPF